jgi:hypothetical protein
MSVSKLLAFCLVTLVSTAAQPEEPPKLPAVIRAPLGTSSSQVLLAKFTVSNLEKSYEFYTKVIGLKWALSAGQQQPPAPQPPAAVRRARDAGYQILRDPPSVGPGEMSFGAIRDPDGYSVEFIQAANYPPTGR